MAIAARPAPGEPTAHSRARMPPIEPPSDRGERSMPSASASAPSAATWSRTVISGNRRAQRPPVRRRSTTARWCPGSRRARWPPPRTTGRCRAGAPGPISPSHQPGVGCPGPVGPTTCASPVSACSTSTALSRCGVQLAPGLVRHAAPGPASDRRTRSAAAPTSSTYRRPGRGRRPSRTTSSQATVTLPWRP